MNRKLSSEYTVNLDIGLRAWKTTMEMTRFKWIQFEFILLPKLSYILSECIHYITVMFGQLWLRIIIMNTAT